MEWGIVCSVVGFVSSTLGIYEWLRRKKVERINRVAEAERYEAEKVRMYANYLQQILGVDDKSFIVQGRKC